MLSKPYRCIGQSREGLLTFDPPSSEMHFSRLSTPAFTIRARYAVFSALTLSFIASFALMFLLYHRRQNLSRDFLGNFSHGGRARWCIMRAGCRAQSLKRRGAEGWCRLRRNFLNGFAPHGRELSAISRQLSAESGSTFLPGSASHDPFKNTKYAGPSPGKRLCRQVRTAS